LATTALGELSEEAEAEGEGVGVQGGAERGKTSAASIGMTLEECIQMLSNAAGNVSTQ